MFGCLARTSISAVNSFTVYTVPQGLLGLFNITARVRGVIAASNCAAVILKFVATLEGTSMHAAPASSINGL